jgi:P-type Cu+ transporter
MSLGTSIAYFASVALLILDAKTPVNSHTTSATYFDSVVFLTFFVITGRYIETFSKRKTVDAVTKLTKLHPTEALLFEESGRTNLVPVELLDIGDRVLVPFGSSPPIDGIIISGFSKFDEASLTGEARLIPKGIGDRVFAGTINKERAVTLSVDGINGQSM